MVTTTLLALTGLAMTLIVIGGIVLFLIVLVIAIYNGLVALRNRVKNAWAQIDVQLKRRYDLIPNLVETAKGYMQHERETLEAVTSARNQAMAAAKAVSANPTDGGAVRSLGGAEGALRGALGNLTVAMEAYPDLKASANMMQVQEELTSTENKVAFSRQAYNDSVMVYNTKRESFPSNIIAGMFNFSEASSFEIEDAAEKEAPKVQFT
ncbi:MAG: LemA family protein [Phycisphaerales bacterium]|nr:LemA family protein [Phycisphaerales bacterium]